MTVNVKRLCEFIDHLQRLYGDQWRTFALAGTMASGATLGELESLLRVYEAACAWRDKAGEQCASEEAALELAVDESRKL